MGLIVLTPWWPWHILQHCGPIDPANICLSMTRVDSIRAYAWRDPAPRRLGPLTCCRAKWDYAENATIGDAKHRSGQIPTAFPDPLAIPLSINTLYFLRISLN